MDQAVILSAVRTPIGKFQGGLAPLSAPQLAQKSLLKRFAARASTRNQWTKSSWEMSSRRG